jgi:hypothetical protein
MSVQKVNVLVPPLRPVRRRRLGGERRRLGVRHDPRHPSGLRCWAAAARALARRPCRAPRSRRAQRAARPGAPLRASQPEFAKDLVRRARSPTGRLSRRETRPARAGRRGVARTPRYTRLRSADLSGLRALYKFG